MVSAKGPGVNTPWILRENYVFIILLVCSLWTTVTNRDTQTWGQFPNCPPKGPYPLVFTLCAISSHAEMGLACVASTARQDYCAALPRSGCSSVFILVVS